MMTDLYPLKFHTIFKDKIWGGDKIHSVLGKSYHTLPNCGETWEISAVGAEQSVVSTGRLQGRTITELIHTYKDQLVGGKVYQKYGDKFPLLFKFISAEDDLSIQVHPDDAAAAAEGAFGKTEMWYVIDADNGSELIFGFNSPITREEYLQAFNTKQLDNILHRVTVGNDDCFFIQPGTVHSIGKGILLAEIQQSSDITYRIYDFDRLDDKGQPRELHTEKALEAINFESTANSKVEYTPSKNTPVSLTRCAFFSTNVIYLDKEIKRDYSSIDSFVVYMCVEGSLSLHYDGGVTDIAIGECVLIPACIKNVTLHPKGSAKILESMV